MGNGRPAAYHRKWALLAGRLSRWPQREKLQSIPSSFDDPLDKVDGFGAEAAYMRCTASGHSA